MNLVTSPIQVRLSDDDVSIFGYSHAAALRNPLILKFDGNQRVAAAWRDRRGWVMDDLQGDFRACGVGKWAGYSVRSFV